KYLKSLSRPIQIGETDSRGFLGKMFQEHSHSLLGFSLSNERVRIQHDSSLVKGHRSGRTDAFTICQKERKRSACQLLLIRRHCTEKIRIIDQTFIEKLVKVE